jgi:predicted ATP-binding protein involved in virulence
MFYLKSLEIENVRCFGKKQQINFTDNNKKNISQWTVILGDNGTGKTTLLRSIVALLPVAQFSYNEPFKYNYKWRKILLDWTQRNDKQNSLLSMTGAECETPFIASSEISFDYTIQHNPAMNEYDEKFLITSPVFCVAYGANRKMAEKSLSDDYFNNISETLFRDDAFLQNSSEYFLRLDYETAKSRKGSEELRKVKELLLKVLPDGIQDIRVVKKAKLQRNIQVKTVYGWVNLNDLSLGHKTTIAWLIDFATKMIYYYENSENPFDEPAILVLDEIDLHMHPSWQREIIENLTKTFPKTQFIVTAHSPLIVQAALNANLVLLKRMNDSVEIINEPNIVKSWRIDQVLTSDLFGLKSSRDKETEKILAQRRRLLLKENLTDIEKEELKKLENKLDEIPIAETPEYIKAMEIVLKMAKRSN